MQKNPTEYKRKFNAENYDRLYVTVKKGKKEELEMLAASIGESLNNFVNLAIDERVEREIKKANR